MNIFEAAVRSKLRFPTTKGLCTVEDLWDLSLDALDKMAQNFYKKIQDGVTVSFIREGNTEDTELNLQFEIVKHIISDKLDARDKLAKEKERKAQKQEIMSIIAEKKSESLKGKSLEELTKLLNDL